MSVQRSGMIGLTAALLLSASAAGSANAGAITDPANDFVPTFLGTHDGSLDVLDFSATFDGTAFHLSATENGDIASFASGLFVIGFNRGAATSNFAAIGHGGVVFDSIITLTSGGATGGRDLVSNTAIVLPAGAAHISGPVFTIDIPLSLLPSQGLLPSQYGVNLWPRDSAVVVGGPVVSANQISDFAPDNSDLVVPEPVSASLLATALLGLSVVRRRRGK